MSDSESLQATEEQEPNVVSTYTDFADGIIKYIDKKLEQYIGFWPPTEGSDGGWNYEAQALSWGDAAQAQARVPNSSEREKIRLWLSVVRLLPPIMRIRVKFPFARLLQA